jgi:hypothetical protein
MGGVLSWTAALTRVPLVATRTGAFSTDGIGTMTGAGVGRRQSQAVPLAVPAAISTTAAASDSERARRCPWWPRATGRPRR